MSDERRVDERISLRQYVEALFQEYKKAHEREHTLLAQGVDLAFDNLKERFENTNEWRAQVNQERGSFVTLGKFEATVESLHTLMDVNHESTSRRLTILDKQVSNLFGRMLGAGTVILFVLSALTIALRFIK